MRSRTWQLALGGWLARWVRGVLLLVAAAGQAMPATNWAPTSGPDGGDFLALAIQPSSPDTLYAGTLNQWALALLMAGLAGLQLRKATV